MASKEFKAFHARMTSKAIDPHLTMQEIRSNFEKLLSDFPPERDVLFENFSIQNIPAMKCSWPKQEGKGVILFFHAGAYNAGSNHSHRDLMGRLSKGSRMPVIGIDYRLAPENPFPAALYDALAAYQYLLENAYEPSDIILAGCSAGGGLILALMLRLKQERMPLPKGAVCICPWADLAMTGKSIASNNGKDIISCARLESSVSLYCGAQDRKDPLISPLYGDLSGFPPLLIQVGDQELLLDEAVALARSAKESGVFVELQVWPKMCHTWQLFAAKIPEGRQAILKISAWIRKLPEQTASAS